MVAILSCPVIDLPVELIDESELNPRDHWLGIAELGESLKAGQLEAIIVRPHPGKPGRYQLADGARRLKAARHVKLPTLAGKVCELSDVEVLTIALKKGAEHNVDPLTPMEEAIGYERARLLGLTMEEIALRFGKSHGEVSRRLVLLQLPAAARDAVQAGELSARTAYYIARIPGEKIRGDVAKMVLHSELYGGVMPLGAAQELIRKMVCRTLRGAPFDPEDATLVPAAGACGGCPFKAGNDKDTYGDVKNPATCMHVSCFETKQAAAQARVLERETAAGKLALPPEVNARVYPPGEHEIAWNSDYVAFTQPVAKDLLKHEVAKVPTWKEICTGDGASVTVYVGFDQAGRAVDLVKLEEALLAADENEIAIFNAETIRRHQLAKGAATQKKERGRKLGKAAAASARDDEEDADSSGAPENETAEAETDSDAGETEDSWSDRVLAWIAHVLEAAPTLPPTLRTEGAELIRVFGTGPAGPIVTAPAAAAAVVADTGKLAEWQKAHGAGMSPQKIAAMDHVSLEDVCGALEIDVHQVRNGFSQLRQDVEASFEACGLKTDYARDRMTRFACNGVAAFGEVTTPEQLHALLRVLSAKASGVPAGDQEAAAE